MGESGTTCNRRVLGEEVAHALGHAKHELHLIGGGVPIGVLSHVLAQAVLSQLHEENPLPPIWMFTHTLQLDDVLVVEAPALPFLLSTPHVICACVCVCVCGVLVSCVHLGDCHQQLLVGDKRLKTELYQGSDTLLTGHAQGSGTWSTHPKEFSGPSCTLKKENQ